MPTTRRNPARRPRYRRRRRATSVRAHSRTAPRRPARRAGYTPTVSPFRRLLSYALRYRQAFLLGLLCVVITQGVALAAPMVLRYAIDDLTRGVTRAKLVEYAFLLLAIGLVGGLFRFLMRRILTGVSRHIEYDMRNDFFAHLQSLPLGYFQSHRTGDLMSRATNDLNAVRMMIGPSVMYSANTLLTFVVALT